MSDYDNGIYTPDEVREIFIDFINTAAKEDYFGTLLKIVRKAAEHARQDKEIKEILCTKLDMCVRCYPEIEKAANIFRVVYLDGEKKPPYREIGIQFYMDGSTARKYALKVFPYLVTMMYGIAGIKWESVEESESLA